MLPEWPSTEQAVIPLLDLVQLAPFQISAFDVAPPVWRYLGSLRLVIADFSPKKSTYTTFSESKQPRRLRFIVVRSALNDRTCVSTAATNDNILSAASCKQRTFLAGLATPSLSTTYGDFMNAGKAVKWEC